MRSVRILGSAIVFALATGVVGAAAPTPPAAPVNLEVAAVTQSSVTLAWGPSQPGAFYNAGEGKNYLMAAWGLSQDTRGPVTYTFSKDGQVLASGLTTNTVRVSVPPGRKNRSFRTCVTAQLPDGRSSAPTCATWSN